MIEKWAVGDGDGTSDVGTWFTSLRVGSETRWTGGGWWC